MPVELRPRKSTGASTTFLPNNMDSLLIKTLAAASNQAEETPKSKTPKSSKRKGRNCFEILL